MDVNAKYMLFAKIANCSYTIANNNRNANFGITGAQKSLNVFALNQPAGAAGRLVFGVEGDFTIKRIKLRSDGAPGLQPGTQHYAGEFDLQMVFDDGNGNIYPYDSIHVRIPEFNTWNDVNLTLKPYKKMSAPVHDSAKYVTFSIEPTGAAFYCDDFNVQSDYVGQGVNLSLIMEVEDSNGVVCQTNGVIF